jgi:hypothetical protein
MGALKGEPFMRHQTPFILALVLVLVLGAMPSNAATGETLAPQLPPPEAGADLDLTSATVEYLEALDLLVFEIRVAGRAGGTAPSPRGKLDGAPVLGYVFPTDLAPEAAGFRTDEGTLALAVTAHPDFDDTPLWDENGNLVYDDDGVVFHSHWVVLGPDSRVPGGLAVREVAESEIATVLPPTNPGMPMMLDSPGFSVVRRGSSLKVLVPAARVGGQVELHFDAVAAYMEVGPGEDRPLLGVYRVYEILSGDLSLPYEVSR